MNRNIRYQGAILRDHYILLIRQLLSSEGRFVWLFPGGNTEPGESEEECVRREIMEETTLNVKVVSLLLDEHQHYPNGTDQQVRTHLCEPDAGEASPGIEPEYRPEVDPTGSRNPLISEVRWFDLRNESTRDPELINDPIIYLPLQRVRKKLGYVS